MALLHIPLAQIDEGRLQTLIVGGAAESRTIDYKRTSYGSSDGDYSEFLADISSFANTSGGDLILGMEAANGVPTAVVPLTVPIDPEVLRLEQVARGGLQPRLQNIAFHPVAVQGGNVLVVRIPRSFNQPHRVVRKGSNRFWARGAAGKYEPDVSELRHLFVSGPQLTDRVRDFVAGRIALIAADQAPVLLMNRGILAVHIIPLSAFDIPPQVPLLDMQREYRIFAPIGSTTANGARITFDGVLKTSSANAQALQHRAYTLLYRNGILEAVTSTIINEGTGAIASIDDVLVREIGLKLADLAAIGIEPPYAVSVALVAVRGARFNFSRPFGAVWYDNLSDPLDRDQYRPPEVVFESVPTTAPDCADVLRPILDQFANAGGAAVSPIFDQQGRYIPLTPPGHR